jgi:predicted metalloprotease
MGWCPRRGRGRRQRPAGAPGTPGRLLCRRLGPAVAAQNQWLEAGDIEEALTTASAIGDDRLQKQSQGTVVPDSFTHGTSEQRVRWFRTGFETGDPTRCDTFSTARL